jgi:hypothetical protein
MIIALWIIGFNVCATDPGVIGCTLIEASSQKLTPLHVSLTTNLHPHAPSRFALPWGNEGAGWIDFYPFTTNVTANWMDGAAQAGWACRQTGSPVVVNVVVPAALAS